MWKITLFVIFTLLIIQSCTKLTIHDQVEIKLSENGLSFNIISSNHKLIIKEISISKYENEKKSYIFQYLYTLKNNRSFQKNIVFKKTDVEDEIQLITKQLYFYVIKTNKMNFSGYFIILNISNPDTEEEIDFSNINKELVVLS